LFALQKKVGQRLIYWLEMILDDMDSKTKKNVEGFLGKAIGILLPLQNLRVSVPPESLKTLKGTPIVVSEKGEVRIPVEVSEKGEITIKQISLTVLNAIKHITTTLNSLRTEKIITASLYDAKIILNKLQMPRGSFFATADGEIMSIEQVREDVQEAIQLIDAAYAVLREFSLE
jgi:hypothetical protein